MHSVQLTRGLNSVWSSGSKSTKHSMELGWKTYCCCLVRDLFIVVFIKCTTLFIHINHIAVILFYQIPHRTSVRCIHCLIQIDTRIELLCKQANSWPQTAQLLIVVRMVLRNSSNNALEIRICLRTEWAHRYYTRLAWTLSADNVRLVAPQGISNSLRTITENKVYNPIPFLLYFFLVFRRAANSIDLL